MIKPSEFIQEWMDTVCSNNSSSIASLYKEDAVLLGTLDKSVRKGRDSVKEYFDFFVKLKPCGKITELVEEDYGYDRFCVVNGTYDFNLTENDEQVVAPARFTFVLERIGTKWMIQSHHSSKQP
tara:strand:- start:827 stop:1198 length:372 start_codon:yes stop_codon:yes gene_type:complete